MIVTQAFLGIDGGGTKTDLAIVDANGDLLVSKQGPTSNQAIVGFAQASGTLIALITEAAAEVDLALPLTAGWIGMAGSDRPEDRDAFGAALDELVSNLRVTNDAELVLSGTPGGVGIALIAGTGSIAYGRNEEGASARSGGWGHIFGDEGSAYRVAVDGLRAVAAAADGRGSETALTAALMAAWKAETPQALITHVYRPEVRKADIAATAPVVVTAAENGDAIALTILHDAGDDLASLVSSLARRIPFAVPPPVACTGGLILQSAIVRDRVISRLDPRLVIPRLTPVDDIAVSVAQAVRRQFIGEST